MFLWDVWYKDEEWWPWPCFVIAKSRGKAKALFQEYWREGEFTDVRCRKVMPIDGHEEDEGVYDAPCPLLEELGVRYLPDEEKECLEVE